MSQDEPFFSKGYPQPESPVCEHGIEQRWCNRSRATDGRLCADIQAEVDLGLAPGTLNASAALLESLERLRKCVSKVDAGGYAPSEEDRPAFEELVDRGMARKVKNCHGPGGIFHLKAGK
jgi:hypothetical protein